MEKSLYVTGQASRNDYTWTIFHSYVKFPNDNIVILVVYHVISIIHGFMVIIIYSYMEVPEGLIL